MGLLAGDGDHLRHHRNPWRTVGEHGVDIRFADEKLDFHLSSWTQDCGARVISASVHGF